MIKKYFSGNCSEEEKHEIYLYFRRNPSLFLDHFSEEDFIATEQSQKGEALDVAKAHKLILGFKRKDVTERSFLQPVYYFLLGFLLLLFKKIRERILPMVCKPLTIRWVLRRIQWLRL